MVHDLSNITRGGFARKIAFGLRPQLCTIISYSRPPVRSLYDVYFNTLLYRLRDECETFERFCCFRGRQCAWAFDNVRPL